MSEPRIITTEPMVLAAVRDTIEMSQIRTFFDQGFGRLSEVLAEQGVTPSGPALGVYWGVPSDTCDVAVAFPTDQPIVAADGVQVIELAPKRAAQVIHEGDFEQLADSWRGLHEWSTTQGHTPDALMWEAYLTEPTPGADPADMRTQLTWPLQS